MLADMLSESDKGGIEKLVKLFNLEDKKSVERYCRDLLISSDDRFHIILAGRAPGIRPYLYACHFDQRTPEHLNPTDRDLAALASNGVGTLSRSARKTVTKISQIFQDRRLFSAHLFYTPSHKYWHLFYFDQRDVTAERNHWKIGGPHIHYSRESFCREPLREVWQAIRGSPPRPPRSFHIRYDYHHNRPNKVVG
jgi:hypothetical protein